MFGLFSFFCHTTAGYAHLGHDGVTNRHGPGSSPPLAGYEYSHELMYQ